MTRGDTAPVDLDALLARCTFPAPGTAVTAAVSGGPDSLALLVLAVASGCEVTAVHVDHGLRAGSAREADVVAAAAEALGAAWRAEHVVVAPGPNLEARARAARRAVLPDDACTGHTLDDRAETVLVNLLRGAGTTGLAALRPGTRHPILALRRSETAALCAARGLAPVEDPSNTDARFVRNRVRHEVLPLLAEVAGRDLVPVLARQAGLLADDADLLGTLAAEVDPTDASALDAAPAPLARAAVRAWLRPTADGQPPSAAAVERVRAVAAGDAVATEVPGGWRVRRSRGRLHLDPPSAPS
ncbi:tRNA lysidine(34) synthetase TilS [Iamia majanohamensis]|uniref:tRNA(Ile)-lysidine synthase n=1 Tax=Iamia majanohamensis TaxID=467976 RepID=A0AAF0BV66_9ACTN|nr:tRNA lysidine(34) synthetase TilS [Iamia majanohamensis]WCO66475.1 tRNA lysidine(34) synthetase TilS [Iamia majanohamensis]